ncbi:hypothetical protein K503DRAFT_863739 [Rhizopogon vinicolor AM-OR11-026]|uniref:Telomeric single stranded DNA binding POT1/Cdc13 domain-containing protein n=1 Tax=Rhizopogon vinicolor AM-OR11-026 TaxID=1314800 RepID=A0A1B7N9V0_9AGAM|nr:hypothetical protein K503DRAFT_863739 [Rhizopogon vinicolor AM-OR11-026]
MISPRLSGTRQLNLEISGHGNKHRFLVILGSKVLDKLSPFPFHPGDIIRFSLKGAHIERRSDSSSLFYLPVSLTFNDGLAVMLMSGPEPGKVFNTWEVDWFDTTLDIPRVADVVMHDTYVGRVEMATTNPGPSTFPQILLPETVVSEKSLEVAPVPASHEHRTPSPAGNLPQSDTQPHEKLSRAQKRRRRRKERKIEELEVQAALEARPESSGCKMAAPQVETVPSRVPPLPPTIVTPPSNPPFHEPASPTSEKSIPITETMSSPPPVTNPTSSHRQGALAMKAGLVMQGGAKFSAFKMITPGFIHVIGIVVSTKSLRQTRTNAWTRSFSLVDPSCMEDDMDVVNHELIVNCFQKKHVERLPHAEVGDIVLFRMVKAFASHGSFTGVGYDDKLRWVTYDPNTRRFRDPDRKDAPHSEILDGGLGYSFSPFYKPNMQGKEAEYCAQLADWWQEMQAKNQDITTVQCVARGMREHRLISDVTPDIFPQGYFDCTVEILHAFENTDRPYVIMEMWGKAKVLAQTMQPGEFWYLPNSRLIAKNYFEGKLVEIHKSRKLNETQSDQNPHLCALLERKKKYEQSGGTAGSSTQIDRRC